MSNKISYGMFPRVARAIVDLLHNKPAADVEYKKAEANLKRAEAELKRAEAEDKRGDAILKEAKSKYIIAKARKETVNNYLMLDEYLIKVGLSKEERSSFFLKNGHIYEQALEEIDKLHSKGRILSIHVEEEV